MEAELKNASFIAAENESKSMQQEKSSALDRTQKLQIVSSISGIVLTPHMHDLVGSYLAEGTEVTEVADTSSMRAQIYVPEDELQKLEKIDRAVLRMDSSWRPTHGTFESFSPVSHEMAKGLIPPAKYKGMRPPTYYVLKMDIPNARGELLTGMTGTARVYGQKRSVGAILFKPVVQMVMRRIW